MARRKTIPAAPDETANSQQDIGVLSIFREEAETVLGEECAFRMTDDGPDTPLFYGPNPSERILFYLLVQRVNRETDDQTPELLQWAGAMEEFAGRIREAFGQPLKRAA